MEVELPDELPESERHTREAGRVSNLSLSHTHCLGVSLKLLLNASLKVFLEPAGWHVMPGRRRPGMTCQAAGSRTTFNEAFKRSIPRRLD